MSENTNNTFCLRCFLFGHKWTREINDEITFPGYTATRYVEKPACMRCGEPNPNHERVETAAAYKRLREKLGLTQEGLAVKLGVTTRTITKRENGATITKEAEIAIKCLAGHGS